MTARAIGGLLDIVRCDGVDHFHSGDNGRLPRRPHFRRVIGTDLQCTRIVASDATHVLVRRIMPGDLGKR